MQAAGEGIREGVRNRPEIFFLSLCRTPGWLPNASVSLSKFGLGPFESKSGLGKASGLKPAAHEGIREGVQNKNFFGYL